MLNRRTFLSFLSLPVVMPVARSVQAAYYRFRKPLGWFYMDMANEVPVRIELTLDGISQGRIIFPSSDGKRRRVRIPIWTRAKTFQINFDSSRMPFRLWQYELRRPPDA
jgi:hypothetical protein